MVQDTTHQECFLVHRYHSSNIMTQLGSTDKRFHRLEMITPRDRKILCIDAVTKAKLMDAVFSTTFSHSVEDLLAWDATP